MFFVFLLQIRSWGQSEPDSHDSQDGTRGPLPGEIRCITAGRGTPRLSVCRGLDHGADAFEVRVYSVLVFSVLRGTVWATGPLEEELNPGNLGSLRRRMCSADAGVCHTWKAAGEISKK